MDLNEEIGRELSAADLKVKTVVVLRKEGRPAITSWVSQMGSDYVAFYNGVGNTTFLAMRKPDDTLWDDTPMRIHVFEYLGEI